MVSVVNVAAAPDTDISTTQPSITAEDAQLGDEYISLTFNESSDEDSEDEDAGTDDDESDGSEGIDPNPVETEET
jgi:hypothetical protein